LANKLPIQPISLTSLRDQARAIIRARVITGEIAAGQIYSAPTLAEELGVSATPVREAMLDLVSEGLVEAVRNTGFRVAVLTDADLDEILELRLMLEVPAMAALTGRVSPDRLKHFDKAANQIEKAALDGDLAAFLGADREFHMGLLQEHPNRRLVEIIGKLRDQARLTGLPHLAHPTGGFAAGQRQRFIESAKEHRSMVRALAGKQKTEVEQVVRGHLVHSRGLWAGREEKAP
jgi:DNA-binding GntR family transcriptional regulator